MLRSTYRFVQDLSDALLRFPELVRGFERKSPHALSDLDDWIDRAERLLSSQRLVAAADVAGYKAKMLAPSFDDVRRTGLRRRRAAAALGLMHDLQHSVQTALAPHADRVEQARAIARQLLQVVARSGAIVYDPASSFQDLVDSIWALCLGHDQLKPHATQLLALLSQDDVRLLLAELVDPADFVDAQRAVR